jgi:hypothetical protein
MSNRGNKSYLPTRCCLWKWSIICYILLNSLTALTIIVQILGKELAAVNWVLVLPLLTVAYICLVLSSFVIDLV